MARRASVAAPTTLSLSSSYRIPSTDPFVRKTLGKLSRKSLLAIVGEWLDSSISASCMPDLGGDDADDDGDFIPAQSLDELKVVYDEFQKRKGGKKEVLNRILEGDWRHGISLRQLATADVQYLQDHSTSQKWTALKLDRIVLGSIPNPNDSDDAVPAACGHLPRFHPPTFLQNLQSEVGPVARAHYHLTKLASLSTDLLRIQMHSTPYSKHEPLSKTQATGAIDTPTILYVAFPTDTSFLYVSSPAISGQSKAGDGKALRKVVIDALPKAFSRPCERYALKPTSLSAKSLTTLISMRGSGRGSAANSGWSIFAEGSIEESPLVATPSISGKWEHDKENKENMPFCMESHGMTIQKVTTSTASFPAENPLLLKGRINIANSRFGHSNLLGTQNGLGRLDIRIEDSFTLEQGRETAEGAIRKYTCITSSKSLSNHYSRRPTISLAPEPDDLDEHIHKGPSGSWVPNIHLTFHGSNVFAGIRQLVESGAILGQEMPGWMSGEDGISVGVVRNQKVKGAKGSGL